MNTGPPPGRRRASPIASRNSAAIASLPFVSPAPPGIRIAACALPLSTVSRTSPGSCRAEAAMASRSTVSGSSAMLPTQRTPSIRSAPGLITQIRSRGKPQASTLSRMIRPKPFLREETPSTAIEPGWSSRSIFSRGRAGAGFVAGASRPRPSSGTSRCRRNANGLTSSSARSGPSSPRSTQNRCPSSRKARKQRNSSPSVTMRWRPRARPERIS